MKISYNWLKLYLDLDISTDKICDALPNLGFDIDAVEVKGPPIMKDVVVGEVVDFKQHPNADRLRLCDVNIGQDQKYSIVCGAKNFDKNDRVLVALPGAELPGGFKIKKSKLRGIISEGMLCSAKELNIGNDHDGIMVLPSKTPLNTPINDLFSDNDTIFDIEITPNRGDVLSHIGLARELVAKFNGELKMPKIKLDYEPSKELIENTILNNILVENHNNCPYYTALIIENVKVDKSPKWLVECLESIGLRSINNIVDITNYILHEVGQPLHAYDAEKIEGKKLVVRNANDGEKIKTLDGKEYTLDNSMMVIADTKKSLAIAGIMGAVNSEVDFNTNSIIIEAASFKSTSIRKTSKSLSLSTDSSYRFERKTDLNSIKYAISRASDLILELAKGSYSGINMEIGSNEKETNAISFSPDALINFIGFYIEYEEIEKIFCSLRFKVNKLNENNWEILVPSYRNDLCREVDLYEEFIRILGTDKIPVCNVSVKSVNYEDNPVYLYSKKSSQYLLGKGFSETYMYSLRDGKEYEFFYGKDSMAFNKLRLDNPLQEDQSHLRNSLIPGLIDVLSHNKSNQTGGVRFFENGRVFYSDDQGVTELFSLAFVCVVSTQPKKWLERANFDFYNAKSILENLYSLLDIDNQKKLEFMPLNNDGLWQDGHSAIAGNLLDNGYEFKIGLLNVKSLKERWSLVDQVYGGSMVISLKSFNKKNKVKRYNPFSTNPSSKKDLSLIIEKQIFVSEVIKELKEFCQEVTESFECEAIDVFDVYEGDGLGDNERSITVSMTFRAQDRTLKDKEVNSAFEKIQSLVENNTNYKIRK